MNDLYLLCETRNCPRRAEPGRTYCVVCANRLETNWTLTRVRIPANNSSALAVLGTLMIADSQIQAMQDNIVRARSHRPLRVHVGYWCHACKCYAPDFMRACRCSDEIQDAKAYFRFKAMNWRPCFADQ